MSNTVKDLTSLLELPGLSNLVKVYTASCIKVDNRYLNRKQFKSTKHKIQYMYIVTVIWF